MLRSPEMYSTFYWHFLGSFMVNHGQEKQGARYLQLAAGHASISPKECSLASDWLRKHGYKIAPLRYSMYSPKIKKQLQSAFGTEHSKPLTKGK